MMNSEAPNPYVKGPALRRVILRLAMLVLLLATLASVAGCQPASKPTTGASQAPGTQSEGPAVPVGSVLDLGLLELSLSQYLRFGHRTTKDGLSNDAIWVLAQDRQGLMWIGTYAGLNQYDGSSFKVYRHDPDDPFSLSDDAVRGLIVDQGGVLWVRTWNEEQIAMRLHT